MQTLDKFNELRAALLGRHFERHDEVDLSLVAILTRYHFVMVGPPGTAKSMLAQDICSSFEGSQFFEHQLNAFSVPEELFGPINLSALEHGRHERVIDLMLPEADIAFIDEVFKANSAILNTLLLAMNERKYKHGNKVIDIPLISLFAASNELPESEELGAMFDRFHLRKKVSYIKEPSNFQKLLTNDSSVPLPKLTFDDLLEAQSEVARVKVNEDVIDTLMSIRSDLNLEGIIVSDRRYKQSIEPMKAMAWLAGRDTVTDDDVGILQHMFWTQPNDIKKVARIILGRTNPIAVAAEEIIDVADDISSQLTAALMDCRQKSLDPKEALAKQGVEWFGKCHALVKDIKNLQEKAKRQGRTTNKIAEAKARVSEVIKVIGIQIIGIDSLEDL